MPAPSGNGQADERKFAVGITGCADACVVGATEMGVFVMGIGRASTCERTVSKIRATTKNIPTIARINGTVLERVFLGGIVDTGDGCAARYGCGGANVGCVG